MEGGSAKADIVQPELKLFAKMLNIALTNYHKTYVIACLVWPR